MTKSELQAQVIALQNQIAQLADVILESNALKARLAVGHTVCKEQRARIVELEALLATRGCIATPPAVAPAAAPEHKVVRFTKKDGSIWERHSWKGNSRAVLRPVLQ
jgi:hypothetical protein